MYKMYIWTFKCPSLEIYVYHLPIYKKAPGAFRLAPRKLLGVHFGWESLSQQHRIG